MVHYFLARDFANIPATEPAPGLPQFAPDVLSGQKPDAHLNISRNGQLTGRCSLWWKSTPALDGQTLGYIGHYAADSLDEGSALLTEAMKALREQKCNLAVGPIDGNTWRRYRLVTEVGTEPPFFLEPTNPPEWPVHFQSVGFVPLAEYYSALNTDLSYSDPRMQRAEERLKNAGVSIRPFRPEAFFEELRRIYAVSVISFASNFLYTPLDEAAFIAQYEQIKPLIDPRFVLLAEYEGRPVGYIFAISDRAQAQRGQPVDTIILKTVAVLPSRIWAGLGSVLVDQVQRIAHQHGYQRAIHALMHESNKSRNISGHYAQTIRRYTLFAHSLDS